MGTRDAAQPTAAVAGTGAAGPWWRQAVVYEVYVRAFCDGDGDGVGDLAGVRSKLPYLSWLGVDAVWLTPFYPSPQVDDGYDVTDHRDVDPELGDLDELDALIADAHRHGLRVLVDIVPNHVADQHPWFRAALAAAPGSPVRERFIFRDGRGPGGVRPPNNWQSDFDGPAWTREPERPGRRAQWWLHLFAPEQPDLNWAHPDVVQEFDDILRFWLDRGVDGLRIDVAHGLVKHDGLPDNPPAPPPPPGIYLPAGHQWDQPGVHEVYRRWRAILDGYDGQRMAIGEAWVGDTEAMARYVRPDELHQVFNFHVLQARWDAGAFRAAVIDSLAAVQAVGALPTWVLSNHDVVRPVTRYGGGPTGTARARAATLVMLALPGSAYLYQGEELGLPEVVDLPPERRRDPMYERSGGTRGRDGCRVPLPWEVDAPNAGFSTAARTWLPQPEGWAAHAADRQRDDAASTLRLVQRALHLRRRLLDGLPTSITWLDAPPGVLTFRRGRLRCTTSFAPAPVPALPRDALVVLSSRPLTAPGEVPPDTTVWWQPAESQAGAPDSGGTERNSGASDAPRPVPPR